MSLPHATEKMQWEALVFKVGGKMFALAALEPQEHWLSFKCSDEDFAELVEREGVTPAPYLARARWVALQTEDALPTAELKRLLRDAHGQVFAKLTKKAQRELAGAG
jgi:predicted DNA-binding protein (MmcQ/YjbR family)